MALYRQNNSSWIHLARGIQVTLSVVALYCYLIPKLAANLCISIIEQMGCSTHLANNMVFSSLPVVAPKYVRGSCCFPDRKFTWLELRLVLLLACFPSSSSDDERARNIKIVIAQFKLVAVPWEESPEGKLLHRRLPQQQPDIHYSPCSQC